MEQDLALLQNISDTLKDTPNASQRQLAKNADMSLGMMNAILGRFVERGWIMLSNVNARKLAYAVTPAGIKELSERSKRFAKKTFELANKYNQVLEEVIQKAKDEGKTTVCLYGESQIRFLIEYTCGKVGVEFKQEDREMSDSRDVYYLIGENISDEKTENYINIVDLLEYEYKGG